MELAIPLIALGGMYLSSKNDIDDKKLNTKYKEKYQNLNTKPNIQTSNPEGITSNYLPNVHTPPSNYPVTNVSELTDTVRAYPNGNAATDKYFNQQYYKNEVRDGKNVGEQIQNIYSLTGDYMSSKEFSHSNMNPLNGKKPQGQIYNNNNAETIMDNYIGSGSQTIKKVEQAPLFNPQENVQWTHGTPNYTDFYQSRVNPSNRNNMVKPFESERVGPGLDKGYGTEGNGGFNSGMESRDRWMPKTVDELRVATNPKQVHTLDGHEGPALSKVTNIGIEGKVEKYRPDTYFVNNADRWLKTTGTEKASRVIPKEIIKTSHRNDTTTYQQGTASSAIKTASYTPMVYEDSKRNQLDAPNVGPSIASGIAPHHTDKDNAYSSHTNYNNNRSTTKDVQTYGSGFTGAIGAVMAPLMDILKPTKKEEYSSNIRVYGNSAGGTQGQYTLTKDDVPNTTIKETTLYEPNSYIGHQNSNAYLVSKQQSVANQRDTTNTSQINGIGGAGSKYGERNYDSDYRQTNNPFKEQLVASRTNVGNAKQLNTYTNMSIAKNENDRNNNRLWAPQSTNNVGPSKQTHGHVNALPYTSTAQSTNGNTIDSELLQAFKNNPYTHNLDSVA